MASSGEKADRPLTAGAAVAVIDDIAEGSSPAGYGASAWGRGEGIADSLSIAAVVVEAGSSRAAIVTGDLLLVNQRLADGVFRALRHRDPHWKRDDLYFGATHTHSGPSGYAGALAEMIAMGPPRQGVAEKLAARIAEAIAIADARRQPAEWAHAALEVEPKLVRNRTREDGPVNRWLDLVSLRSRVTGRSIANLVVFGAHATCRPARDRRLSADFPGELRKRVEATLGGPCLFLAGAVGSQAPRYDQVPRDQLAAWQAERLTREVERAAELLSFRGETIVEVKRVVFPMPRPAVRLGSSLTISPILASVVTPREASFHRLRLGDVILLGAPADYAGVLAEELRTAAPGATTIVTSFNGDYVGYAIPASDYDLPRYEPRAMALYGPRGGEYLQEAAKLFLSSAGSTNHR